jgi:hypothetical protein
MTCWMAQCRSTPALELRRLMDDVHRRQRSLQAVLGHVQELGHATRAMVGVVLGAHSSGTAPTALGASMARKAIDIATSLTDAIAEMPPELFGLGDLVVMLDRQAPSAPDTAAVAPAQRDLLAEAARLLRMYRTPVPPGPGGSTVPFMRMVTDFEHGADAWLAAYQAKGGTNS